eukprot:m.707548 g.707548  ORF g.707548 m.707548 type:complete len:197 (+) comp22935_c0_seq60:239-829(+)
MAASNDSTPNDAFLADLFRRVDKNDDGHLSLLEFRQYFRDGVMSSEELVDLFSEIDMDKNGTIEISELQTLFTKNIGSFSEGFEALARINDAITSILRTLPATQQDVVDEKEMFFKRFFLNELTSSVKSLQHPLDAAAQGLTDEALTRRHHTVFPEQSIIHGDRMSCLLASSVCDGMFTITCHHVFADLMYCECSV